MIRCKQKKKGILKKRQGRDIEDPETSGKKNRQAWKDGIKDKDDHKDEDDVIDDHKDEDKEGNHEGDEDHNE